MENQTAQVIAMGLTARQWVEMLNSDKAKKARKALNYLDGQQETEMELLLSDPNKGRKQWRERGFIARYRGLTKMVVEKSGQLFKDKAPAFEIFQEGSVVVDDNETKLFMDEMYKTEWQEFFINVDQVVRLLKTAIVLIQYDNDERKMVLDVLHRGNCQVVINPATRGIDALIYRTSEDGGSATYRIITKEQFIDLAEEKDGPNSKIVVTAVNDNPFLTVPAVQFYDTTVPRSGFWNEASHELIGLNELVNLHLTDSEFAISWAKRQTPITNCVVTSGNSEVMEAVEVFGSALPKLQPATQSAIAGPDRGIFLDSSGVDSPFFEYKGPNVDFQTLDSVVDNWIKSFAADWSVRIRASGEGQAQSGFQVVVEEMPNLELRQQRQRMFEAGFKRFFRVFRTVISTVSGTKNFKETSELFVEFPNPNLPVDTKVQEEVWSMRIKENRATVIDYLMETQGLSEDEANEKWKEIKAFNEAEKPEPEPVPMVIDPNNPAETVVPTETEE